MYLTFFPPLFARLSAARFSLSSRLQKKTARGLLHPPLEFADPCAPGRKVLAHLFSFFETVSLPLSPPTSILFSVLNRYRTKWEIYAFGEPPSPEPFFSSHLPCCLLTTRLNTFNNLCVGGDDPVPIKKVPLNVDAVCFVSSPEMRFVSHVFPPWGRLVWLAETGTADKQGFPNFLPSLRFDSSPSMLIFSPLPTPCSGVDTR